MRQQILSLVLILSTTATAGAADLSAPGKVRAVTIFADRAQVTREILLDLPAGDSSVLLPGLPGELLTGSLQVTADASQQLRFGALDWKLKHEEGPTAPRERALAVEIEALRDRLNQLDDRIRTAELRLGFVSALAERAPQGGLERVGEGKLEVEALERTLALVDRGAREALAERREALVEKRRLSQEIEARERERAELASGARAVTEVRVSLSAETAGRKAFRVLYQVPSAAWRPRYEARLDSESRALELLQRAEVRQATGEDWSGVALTLSTARPSLGADMPELQPWRLAFLRPRVAEERAKLSEPMAPQMARDASGAAASQDFAALAAGEFTAEWQVPGRVHLPADGSSHVVTLASNRLEADLLLRASPKLDSHAYLYARSRWTSEAPLLPGQVSLVRDGAFIGETALPLLRSGEEASFAFGLDDRLKLDYRVLEATPESRGLVAKRQHRERKVTMVVQNLHRQAIEIELYDQLPLATEEDITVELLAAAPQPSERNPEEKEGLLLWHLQLAAGERREIAFAFAVEYPAERQIVGLESRSEAVRPTER